MPKIVDHDKQRQEMILECFELFSKKGFSNVTMREIANELNVSTGSLYHYFPTKNAIFHHMINYIVERDVKRVQKRILGTMSFAEKMITAGKVIEEDISYFQNLLLLTIDFFRHTENGNKEETFEFFVNHFIKAISLNLNIDEKMSKIIFSWMIGLVYCSLVVPKEYSFNDQTSYITEILSSHFKLF